jgi:hypothetical protein
MVSTDQYAKNVLQREIATDLVKTLERDSRAKTPGREANIQVERDGSMERSKKLGISNQEMSSDQGGKQ